MSMGSPRDRERDRAASTPSGSIYLGTSYDEGDQVLREYRLRKAARDEARRRERAHTSLSEGGFGFGLPDSSLPTSSSTPSLSGSLAGSHRLPAVPPPRPAPAPGPGTRPSIRAGTSTTSLPLVDTTARGNDIGKGRPGALRTRTDPQLATAGDDKPRHTYSSSGRSGQRHASSTGSDDEQVLKDVIRNASLGSSTSLNSSKPSLLGPEQGGSRRSSRASAPAATSFRSFSNSALLLEEEDAPNVHRDGVAGTQAEPKNVVEQGDRDFTDEREERYKVAATEPSSSLGDDEDDEALSRQEVNTHNDTASETGTHLTMIEHESSEVSSQAGLSELDAQRADEAAALDAEIQRRASSQRLTSTNHPPGPSASRDDSTGETTRTAVDNTALGIPTFVVLDGERVDISAMDILDQVEMLRRASAEKQRALHASRRASAASGIASSRVGSGGQKDDDEQTRDGRRAGETSPVLDELDLVKYTELSDIAEQTECSTYSRRYSPSPSMRTSSSYPFSLPRSDAPSQPYPYTGSQQQSSLLLSPRSARYSLHPDAARSAASASVAGSARSGASILISEAESDAKGLTQAERIKRKYMAKSGGDGSRLDTMAQPYGGGLGLHQKSFTTGDIPSLASTLSVSSAANRMAPNPRAHASLAPSSSPSKKARSFVSDWRSYVSSVPLSSSSSSASASSSARLGSPSKPRSRGVHPLSNAYHHQLQRDSHPVTDRSGATSNANSAYEEEARPASPTKRALSPVVAARLAAFERPPYPGNAGLASEPSSRVLQRSRTKSLSSAATSSARSGPSAPAPAGDVFPAGPPLPSSNNPALFPISKSTGDLVRLYEDRSGQPASGEGDGDGRNASPVKEWLKNVSPSSEGRLTPSVSGKGSSADMRSARRRSRSSPDVSMRNDAAENGTSLPSLRSSAASTKASAESSLNDSKIVHHGEFYWLNSSSARRPAFWQKCRAILTANDELRISWPGVVSGTPHERVFDLSRCLSATSVRRTAGNRYPLSDVAENEDAAPRTLSKEDASRVFAFELVWKGRTHRFACLSPAERNEWLGCAFSVLSRYSHSGSAASSHSTLFRPESEKEQERDSDSFTIGAATVHSLDLPDLSLSPGLTRSSGTDTPKSLESAAFAPPARRSLENGQQESLYASVSEMLASPTSSPALVSDIKGTGESTPRGLFAVGIRSSQPASARGNRSVRGSMHTSELLDTPRYQLSDTPATEAPTARSSLGPHGLLPRGAWSEQDRISTKSDTQLHAQPPRRAVARDLRRLLTMMERQDSVRMSRSTEFPSHVASMQAQLEDIAKKLKAQPQTQTGSVASKKTRTEEKRMVGKIDELLSICHTLVEEKQKALPDPPGPTPEQETDYATPKVATDGPVTPVPHNLGQRQEGAHPERRASGLQRIEQQIAMVLARIDNLPTAHPSPESVKQRSPRHNPPDHGAPSDADEALLHELDNRPSTPSIIASMGSDLEADAYLWQSGGRKKRDSALPPLPLGTSSAASPRRAKQPQRPQTQHVDVQAHVSEKASVSEVEQSLVESSQVSSGYIRHERNETAMRLEGSHPDLLMRAARDAQPNPSTVQPVQVSHLRSRWSPEINALDPASRIASRTMGKHPARSPGPSRAQSSRHNAPAVVVTSATGGGSVTGTEPDDSPPTPRQRDFRTAQAQAQPQTGRGSGRRLSLHKDETLLLLRNMQDLLVALVGTSEKNERALEHQQNVSIYLKDLNEFLASDRDARKDEFSTITEALDKMADKLAKHPHEIQALVSASAAHAAVIDADVPGSAPAPNADEAPTSDPDQGAAGPDGGAAAATSNATTTTTSSGPQGSAKAGATAPGSSLLRKVSKKIAAAGQVSGAARVGGPRKMQLFGGHTQADPSARENRWRTGGPRALNPAMAAAAAAVAGRPTQGGEVPSAAMGGMQDRARGERQEGEDQQGPLMEALEDFENQLRTEGVEGEESGNPQTAVIALGIMEVLKLLKDAQAREHAREAERYHAEREQAHVFAKEQGRQMDALRAELREWEGKRAELEAARHDPENRAGIETIIALLKDQMADQERKMAALKEAVTPHLASLNDDTQDAIHEMKEHFLTDLGSFKAEMDAEVKRTLSEVADLREQKKQLQSDLAGLLAFKAKYLGGAPEHAGATPMPMPMSGPGQGGMSGGGHGQHHSEWHGRAGQSSGRGYPAPRPDSGGAAYTKGIRGPR